jgi:3-oxoacyl-(acyl-carrier-protein) synthase
VLARLFGEAEADRLLHRYHELAVEVTREAEIKTAISNSFGFGGHNACIVIREFDG